MSNQEYICKCGNFGSPNCVIYSCGNCCHDINCVKHGKKNIKIKIKNEKRFRIYNEKNTSEYICKTILNFMCYRDINIAKILLLKFRIPIEIRDIIMEYADERKKCKICKYHTDDQRRCIYNCDKCSGMFCTKCRKCHEQHVFCGRHKCYYCMMGTCHNTYKIGTYCQVCYDPKIHENYTDSDDEYYYDYDRTMNIIEDDDVTTSSKDEEEEYEEEYEEYEEEYEEDDNNEKILNNKENKEYEEEEDEEYEEEYEEDDNEKIINNKEDEEEEEYEEDDEKIINNKRT